MPASTQARNNSRLLRNIFAVHATAMLGFALDACPAISLASGTHPACFTFLVGPGAAVQWQVEQASDLAIRLTGEGGAVIVDAFDFGPETVTVGQKGKYRLEVVDVRPEKKMAFRHVAIAPAVAPVWREAELRSTAARRTKASADAALAIVAWGRVGSRASLSRAHLLMGDIAFRASALAQSRVEYEAALVLCQQDRSLRCVAEAANNSGLSSIQLGDFTPARQRLSQARRAWQALGLVSMEGVSLSNLGLLYRRTGDLQSAIGIYDQARTLLRTRDALSHARVLNNLGLCYLTAGDYAKAHLYLASALPIFHKGFSLRDATRTRSNIARAYVLEGNFGAAIELLKQAEVAAGGEKDQMALADVLINLGQAKLGKNLPLEAMAHLERARSISEAIGSSRDLASSYHLLGLAAAATGDLAGARKSLTLAAASREKHGLRDDATASLFELAKLERDARQFPEAQRLARRALDLVESRRRAVPGAALRASYFAAKRRFVDLLVDVSSPEGANPAAGLLAAERGRGRALLDLFEVNQAAGELSSELRVRQIDLEQRIDLLAARLAGNPPDGVPLRQKIEGLIAESEEVQASQRVAQSGSPFSQLVTSVEALQTSGIPADSGMLYFHLGEKSSRLWLVEPKGLQVYILPGQAILERETEAVTSRFGRVTDRRRLPELQREFESAVATLSRSLLGGLTGPLPQRLILAPDGILNAVPFGLLQTPNGQRLGLAHDLINTPSASYLLAGRAPRPPSSFRKSILVLADPVYSTSDPRLAGVRVPIGAARPHLSRLPFAAELELVRQSVPAARRHELRGFEATSGNLARLPLADFGVIQFSTHAQADEQNPKLSWVAVTAFDPAGRPLPPYLHPRHFGAMQLSGSTVILSACDTALGKRLSGEGYLGWTASLFQGGAAQLVLTVAKVEAEASSVFLKETYIHLFSAKRIPAERAATLARRKMAASRRWADPFYWASFVVIGMPARAAERGL